MFWSWVFRFLHILKEFSIFCFDLFCKDILRSTFLSMKSIHVIFFSFNLDSSVNSTIPTRHLIWIAWYNVQFSRHLIVPIIVYRSKARQMLIEALGSSYVSVLPIPDSQFAVPVLRTSSLRSLAYERISALLQFLARNISKDKRHSLRNFFWFWDENQHLGSRFYFFTQQIRRIFWIQSFVVWRNNVIFFQELLYERKDIMTERNTT